MLRFVAVEEAEESTRGPVAEDFLIESAWGVTVEDVGEQEAFRTGAPLPGVLDRSGEWWCVATSEDGRRLVLADRFGFQPLALAVATTADGPALFIGTSASETARAIIAAGGTVSTNWALVLETIGARHDFLDCLFDHSTPFDGISWLPPDKAIEVGATGFRIVSRPETSVHGAYEDLLRRGIDHAIADMEHLLAVHEHVAINLSGGKDSRVVLALVMAAGCSDRVQIAATDPAPPGGSMAHSPTVARDLEISSRLVEKLGLSWVDRRTPRDVWPTTLEGELARFQTLRHGLTNQFVPMALSYRLTVPEARVNGAGGEIFRGYWADVLSGHPVWSTLGHRAETRESDTRSLLRALRSPFRLPASVAERGEQSLVEAMAPLPGSTAAEALDRHYEVFRLRGHAGGRRWGQSYGITNFGLLQQSALMRAAQELERDERCSGRVLFDIVEQVAPELNDLEYQSGPWPWSGQRTPVMDWSDVAPSTASYRRAQVRAQQSARPQRYIARPRPDMAGAVTAGLAALAEQMRTDGLDPTLVGGLRAAPPADLRGQGRLLGRLFHWASGFGDERFLPRAIPAAPPRVRTYA
ncbi:hypothetical protein [Brachybacterium hainanense]|uniref:Asparagine synthetase domain-containing protein n=1 Tax=Brachybacterium hainanense TaxID=1541174 RepID=A0ABV6RFC9_9MICO